MTTRMFRALAIPKRGRFASEFRVRASWVRFRFHQLALKSYLYVFIGFKGSFFVEFDPLGFQLLMGLIILLKILILFAR